MTPLGSELERLCAEAKQEILLVAPFTKKDVVARLLQKVPLGVSVRCVTRWRPEEIIAGVSDIEVWPLLRDRPSASMWLRTDLHVKYYRGDEHCLVGSANLTNMALGWTPHPNLELLVPLEAGDAALRGFEVMMLAGCVQVDDSLFAQVADVIRLMEQQQQVAPIIEAGVAEAGASYTVAALEVEAWLPTLRNPSDLYTAYSGKEDELSSASRDAALFDLQSLPVSPGLTRAAFEACIGFLLLQKPAVKAVDDFVLTPRRFGAVTDLLQRLPCANHTGFNPDRSWQTLMRWLRYFLPERYERSVPRHSEVFARTQAGGTLSSGDGRPVYPKVSRPSRSSSRGGSGQAE